jgi:hypothetical protein
MSKSQFTYQRHKPEETFLYQAISGHVEQFFVEVASDESRKPLPVFVRREFDKYLACGLLTEGFIRLKCTDCNESMVVGYSCKCRGFCPSCAARRMSERSIHAATSIKDYDRDGLQKLIRYMGRGAIALERFNLNEKGEILYKLKNSYDGASHVLLSPMELMEKLSGIIPPPHKHQVTYYGCLSSHSNLRPLVVLQGDKPIKDETVSNNENSEVDQRPGDEKSGGEGGEKCKDSRYIDWAMLLKKVFQIDITICPKCQGKLRIISVINEKSIIKQILDHMGLGSDPPTSVPVLVYENDFSR